MSSIRIYIIREASNNSFPLYYNFSIMYFDVNLYPVNNSSSSHGPFPFYAKSSLNLYIYLFFNSSINERASYYITRSRLVRIYGTPPEFIASTYSSVNFTNISEVIIVPLIHLG